MTPQSQVLKDIGKRQKADHLLAPYIGPTVQLALSVVRYGPRDACVPNNQLTSAGVRWVFTRGRALHLLWDPRVRASWPASVAGTITSTTASERACMLGLDPEEKNETAMAKFPVGSFQHTLLDIQAFLSYLRQTTYAGYHGLVC